MTFSDLTFDAEVRRSEPDLWLASRLVPDRQARASLIALYSVHMELAKVAAAASNPLAGEIRLAWWREEIETLEAVGRTFGHPALQILSIDGVWVKEGLLTMVEARHAELDGRPFSDEGQLLAYLDGVDGALMRAAAAILLKGSAPTFNQLGRAWGWTRLLGEQLRWRSRGKTWTPSDWGEPTDADLADHARHRINDALQGAAAECRQAVVQAFPAIAYTALCAPYARGRSMNALEKRLRILWASLKGGTAS